MDILSNLNEMVIKSKLLLFIVLLMFHLLLLVYVMILDKILFWKISTEDDFEKLVMKVGSSARQGLSDPTLFLFVKRLHSNLNIVSLVAVKKRKSWKNRKDRNKVRALTRILKTGVPELSFLKSGSPTIQKNIASFKK